jgi:hypothetical protein
MPNSTNFKNHLILNEITQKDVEKKGGEPYAIVGFFA